VGAMGAGDQGDHGGEMVFSASPSLRSHEMLTPGWPGRLKAEAGGPSRLNGLGRSWAGSSEL
jgi:hypothetical protein